MDQRPMFRFRLPWMTASAPAPPPVADQTPPPPSTTSQPQTNIEPNVNPVMPARRPFRLSGIATSQPPPPVQPTIISQSQSASITITSNNPTEAPPLWSPRGSANQDSLSQAEVPPQTKSPSQSSPASPARTYSQATSQLPSPSSSSGQYSATSQFPSPQYSATSQPSSPWRIPSQEQDQPPSPKSGTRPSSPKSGPQPASPWRTSPQVKETSQHSTTDSPKVHQPSSQAKEASQPSSPVLPQVHPHQSPSELNFQSAGQTTPVASPQSLTATTVHQTERTETRVPSPSIMSNRIKSPQPFTSPSKQPLSPVSVQPSVSDQSKKDITASVTFKSPTKATIQPSGSAANPPELSGPPPDIANVLPAHKLRSDDTMIDSFTESLKSTYEYTVETKEEGEMLQNTSLAHEEPKQKTMAAHVNDISGSLPHSKEKLNIVFKEELSQLKNHDIVHQKEPTTSKASSLDGKKSETLTSQHADNKSTVSESRKKHISSGDQVPFQKEIRNDISKLADIIAHPENYKDEKPMSVVALVGKNEGASMQLGFESVKRRAFKIHGANKGEPLEGTKVNQRDKGTKRKRSNNDSNKENQTTNAFINNNVQDINNSILMNSFIAERNPGVHIALYHDSTEPETRKGKSTLPLLQRSPMSPLSEDS